MAAARFAEQGMPVGTGTDRGSATGTPRQPRTVRSRAPEFDFDIAIVGSGLRRPADGVGVLHAAGRRVLGVDVSERRLAVISEERADLLASDRERLTAALADPGFEMTSDTARLSTGGRGDHLCADAGGSLPGSRPAHPGKCLRDGGGRRDAGAGAAADLDDLRRHHPRPAGRPAGRPGPDRGSGRVRGVQPRTHRPGQRPRRRTKTSRGWSAASPRRAPSGPRPCCAATPGTCTSCRRRTRRR